METRNGTMKVWILMTGDYCDPSTILGVYATRELGLAALGAAVLKLGIRNGEASHGEDGSVHIDGSPDFYNLTPYEVVTLPEHADRGSALVEISPVDQHSQAVHIAGLDAVEQV